MADDQVIRIRDLEFRYGPVPAKGPPVLKIPEFALRGGERVFLQGESGSGKTTLLGLLTGVLDAQAGEVSVLGTDFAKAPASARDGIRGDRMGYIFQMFNLIPYLSVAENIALPCRLHHERKSRLGSRQLDDEVHRFAKALGIEEFLEQKVSRLSVGQQQRVAAARALIGKPELIIADEPTSALDHGHRKKFIELLMEEWRDRKSESFVRKP